MQSIHAHTCMHAPSWTHTHTLHLSTPEWSVEDKDPQVKSGGCVPDVWLPEVLTNSRPNHTDPWEEPSQRDGQRVKWTQVVRWPRRQIPLAAWDTRERPHPLSAQEMP